VLLIVGGADLRVLDLNRQAQAQLGGLSRLIVVPRATHLFEEPGALAEVAISARGWFLDHLVAAEAARTRPSSQPGSGASAPFGGMS
jgi:putative phosphoribosyl transferase